MINSVRSFASTLGLALLLASCENPEVFSLPEHDFSIRVPDGGTSCSRIEKSDPDLGAFSYTMCFPPQPMFSRVQYQIGIWHYERPIPIVDLIRRWRAANEKSYVGSLAVSGLAAFRTIHRNGDEMSVGQFAFLPGVAYELYAFMPEREFDFERDEFFSSFRATRIQGAVSPPAH